MSTPHEAGLTEKERAILARLAAQAEADDPSLAATLRGRARRAARRSRLVPHVEVPTALRDWRWGVLLAAVGVVLMLISVSVAVALGVVGIVVTFAGTYRAVSAHPGPAKRAEGRRSAEATSDS